MEGILDWKTIKADFAIDSNLDQCSQGIILLQSGVV